MKTIFQMVRGVAIAVALVLGSSALNANDAEARGIYCFRVGSECAFCYDDGGCYAWVCRDGGHDEGCLA